MEKLPMRSEQESDEKDKINVSLSQNINESNDTIDSGDAPLTETLGLSENIKSVDEIKSDLMDEFPLSSILDNVGKSKNSAPKGTESIIEKRYQNCIECGAEIKHNFLTYQKSGNEETGMYIFENFPGRNIKNCSYSYKFAMQGVDHTAPFSGALGPINSMKSIDTTIQFNPHCVIPTPKSAFLPSFMIKAFFKEYCKENQGTIEPQFLLPQFKPSRGGSIVLESKGEVNFSEYIYEKAKETLTYQFKNIESHIEHLRNKFPEHKIDSLIATQNWENGRNVRDTFNNFAKIIESVCNEGEKEVRICVLDEYVSKGGSTRSMSDTVKATFDVLKEIGRIPNDAQLRINVLNLGVIEYYNANLYDD